MRPRTQFGLEDQARLGHVDPDRRGHSAAATAGRRRAPAGARRDSGEGWSNGAEIGKADAPLKRIVAHWFNLPDFHARLGRWETETDGWKITLDVRPDHDRVWTDLHKAHVYVMTHVMELRRADEATFTATEAESVLTALHVGVSFALGRWAAPMLPVGEGANGEVVWESWRMPHCDPARETSPG
jgi:hypothetical protein